MPELSGNTRMTDALVQATDLTLRYGPDTVLRHVNMHVDPGEILTIVGPNGSGKSSLLRALIGALPPAGGTVTRKKSLRIGYVPQKLAIDRTLPLTVDRFLNLPKRVAMTEAATALERAGIPAVGDRQLSELSGGQFQRVLLARALLAKPELLLLDEPTQGLDQPGAAAFYQQIAAVRETLGCAIIMVSHDLHVVMAASDRVLCLNGHVCCQGTPAVVASAPEYRALFGTGTKGTFALYQHAHNHSHDLQPADK